MGDDGGRFTIIPVKDFASRLLQGLINLVVEVKIANNCGDTAVERRSLRDSLLVRPVLYWAGETSSAGMIAERPPLSPTGINRFDCWS